MARSRLMLMGVALCAALGAGCRVDVPEDAVFTCVTNEDCGGDGYVCLDRAGTSGVCCLPSAETCNGVDEDCDGVVDNDVEPERCYTGADVTRGVGACKDGGRVCEGGTFAATCAGEVVPAAEQCNRVDDDCDGQTDESFNLATDAANCGACGNACAAEQKCQGGSCTSASETSCEDGVDNDADGATDCADSECETRACGAGCQCVDLAPRETACEDGASNDGDGEADCADPDCLGQSCQASPATFTCDAQRTCSCSGAAPQPEAQCNDGADQDCDGLVDCADLDCAGASCGDGCACGDGGKQELDCTDGADNDGDGSTDCADPDCAAKTCSAAPATFTCDAQQVCSCNGDSTPPAETACTDGADQDCDGLADCADADCDNAACGAGCVCSAGAKTETECADGSDNDLDGDTDCADPDCDAAACGAGCVCGAGLKQEAACADGQDNDGDGSADCLDGDCGGRACTSAPATFTCDAQLTCSCNGNATPAPETACADAADQDCDGLVDCADGDCAGQSCGSGCACGGGVKTEQLTACNDTADNDGDNQTDCADSDCVGAACTKKGSGQPGTCSNGSCR